LSHTEEDLLDFEAPLNEGDEYSPDHYWAEEEYCRFEAMMEELKYMIWEEKTYGAIWDEADRLAEEDYYQQIAEEQAWEDHLNPIQAFEKQKMLELEVFGSYPDSHDRYTWYGLQAEEAADEFGPEPRNEDECNY